MPSTIWKWTLDLNPVNYLNVPAGTRFLSVGVQYGRIQVWALVPKITNTLYVNREIRMYGTGHDVDESQLGPFLGTIFNDTGRLVLHIFEGKQL